MGDGKDSRTLRFGPYSFEVSNLSMPSHAVKLGTHRDSLNQMLEEISD